MGLLCEAPGRDRQMEFEPCKAQLKFHQTVKEVWDLVHLYSWIGQRMGRLFCEPRADL